MKHVLNNSQCCAAAWPVSAARIPKRREMRKAESFSGSAVASAGPLVYWLPIRRSKRLDPITVNADGKRPLNAVHGNDQAAIILDCREDSADAVQAATPDPNLLTDVEERMRRNRDFFTDNGLQSFDLFVRNGTTH